MPAAELYHVVIAHCTTTIYAALHSDFFTLFFAALYPSRHAIKSQHHHPHCNSAKYRLWGVHSTRAGRHRRPVRYRSLLVGSTYLFEYVSVHIDDSWSVGLVGTYCHRPRPQMFDGHLLLGGRAGDGVSGGSHTDHRPTNHVRTPPPSPPH